MGRSPCCDKVGLKKGPWTPEEDQKLLAYIEEHGHGSWRALPSKAGLQRCGKSCRLRWTNYLRPDIKRGKFSLQEEQTIIQLHALLGNRWSSIATHLPKRTDNEIKNYWNTHLKKRLSKMGIDPVTHKSKNDTLLISSHGQPKSSTNLTHMAQWESARLEAEARLVREAQLRNSHNSIQQHQLGLIQSAFASSSSLNVLKPWNNGFNNLINGGDLDSPKSTLTFSDQNVIAPVITSTTGVSGDRNLIPTIEFVGSSGSNSNTGDIKEQGEQNWKRFEKSTGLLEEYKEMIPSETSNRDDHVHIGNHMSTDQEAGFTDLLLNKSDDHEERSLSDHGHGGNESENGGGRDDQGQYYEDKKNYWNSILNLVNSSPSDSPIF